MNPYEALANAIVEQAVVDYKKALRYAYMHPYDEGYAADVKEVENFFSSPWYQLLTDLDSEFLMERIQKMVRLEVRV
ncbi:MAG: hypothetical protein IJ002_08645 [Clostridia bacterium]|nr:hypothetical protein [Clostridia bacterium]